MENEEEVVNRAEQPPVPLPMFVVRGTGRVIRKDGTIINFTLEGTSSGSDTSNGDS